MIDECVNGVRISSAPYPCGTRAHCYHPALTHIATKVDLSDEDAWIEEIVQAASAATLEIWRGYTLPDDGYPAFVNLDICIDSATLEVKAHGKAAILRPNE